MSLQELYNKAKNAGSIPDKLTQNFIQAFDAAAQQPVFIRWLLQLAPWSKLNKTAQQWQKSQTQLAKTVPMQAGADSANEKPFNAGAPSHLATTTPAKITPAREINSYRKLTFNLNTLNQDTANTNKITIANGYTFILPKNDAPSDSPIAVYRFKQELKIDEIFKKPEHLQKKNIIISELKNISKKTDCSKFNTPTQLFAFCLQQYALRIARSNIQIQAKNLENFYQPANIQASSQIMVGEIYQHDVHPSAIAKIPDLRCDEDLKKIRETLKLPDTGKPLHKASLLRDKQYNYDYTKPDTKQSSSYQHWHVAAVNAQTKQLISSDGLSLAAGWYMYVITLGNQLRFLPCDNKQANNLPYMQYRSHSQLAEGKNVYGAGTFQIGVDGKLQLITSASGHYRPEKEYLDYSVKVLAKMGVDIKDIKLDAEVIQRNEASLWEKLCHFSSVGTKALKAKFSNNPSQVEERPALPRHLNNRMDY